MNDGITAEIVELNYRDLTRLSDNALRATYEDRVGELNQDLSKEEVIIDLLTDEWGLSYIQTWEEYYPPHIRPEIDWED